MASMWRSIVVGCVGGWLCGVAFAQPAVPPALEDWRAWALHGQEGQRCTFVDDAPRCDWPGELRLDVSDDGLRFAQAWTLQAARAVPLPGDEGARPLDVRVDGAPTPVVVRDGVPQIVLAAGEHRVEGRIAWPRRPPTLTLPEQIALIALTIDGEAVASPQRNDEDALVLGAAGAGESDALQIETYRLLADGAPQYLATRLVLSVSGRPREGDLGAVLPAGFVPVLLDGEIPSRVEPDGTLRAQLRPGDWSLLLIGRAIAPTTQFRMPAADAADSPLPAQEIWQFRGDAAFRVAQLTGVAGVDPMQVSVPPWNELVDDDAIGATWSAFFANSDALPAYLLERDSVATLEVKLRGLPAERPARLVLQRDLWLDFDGGGYLAQDSISGDLGSAQRLDMRAPWSLERATRGNAHLLVTQGDDASLSGVELRDPAVYLDTGARAALDGALPANGWTQPFDAASAVLHLPPGYRLLGATGADRADGSWWDAWSLLDLFMLSLFALTAWRLGGIALGGALVVWFLLAWHEPLAPRVSLLAAVALSLLLRHLPAGRVTRIIGWVRNAVLVLVALLVLPFAADQLRMALHPQLEHAAATGDRYASSTLGGNMALPEVQLESMAPPPPPAPSAQAPQDDGVSLDRVQVTGTRVKRVDLFSYPANTIAQAGSARPGWRWHDHALAWNGPLLADATLGLVVSPPWLTRTWRVLAVLLLAFVVLRLVRAQRTVPLRRAAPAASALLLLAFGLGGTAAAPPAHAQAGAAIPSQELLGELRDRLLARDAACEPACVGLGAVTVEARDDILVLQLDAQAQADTAWPLPQPDAALHLAGVSVDGRAAAVLRLDGDTWVALERGVHRVEVRYVANGERWRVAFPLAPATLDVRADGFEIAGVDDGQLIGDTLDLVPPRRATADAPDAGTAPSESVPPFVRVVRTVVLDQQWSVETRLTRVAPLRSGLTVAIALLPGEQVVSAEPADNLPPVRDGRAIVSLPAGVDAVAWTSRLTPADALRLTAADGRGYAEEWRLAVAPLLHAQTSGVPEAGQDDAGGERRFLPLPGETLDIAVSRPAAVAGASIAIENVALRVAPGQQARDSTLTFSLRATRAGQHVLQLPADAELLGFAIDGAQQPLLLDAGKLTLPLRTQPQSVDVRWREAIDVGTVLRTPEVSLGASAANIDLELSVPADRWLLLTRGPTVGPAVLYWSGLAVMLLAAVALARLGGTPLRLHAWLLLGLGFSAISWWPALIVAGWLLLLGWRGRHPELLQHRASMLLQLGIAGLTLLALLCLVLAIPYGLLGQPDMHVAGNNSYGGLLRWFADRSADGTLPVASAITLPLWCYKLAILLWSLWLASALMRWLRWGWTCANAGALWPARRRAAAPATTTTTPTQ